ncbi:hypothetical protein [Planococcus shixiaomingii]|nr:hypothetical protein [Planococcus sp. N028]
MQKALPATCTVAGSAFSVIQFGYRVELFIMKKYDSSDQFILSKSVKGE